MTFARPVAPYNVGDKRCVPDTMAKKLADEGLISDSEVWPAAPAPTKPARAVVKPVRPVVASAARLAQAAAPSFFGEE